MILQNTVLEMVLQQPLWFWYTRCYTVFVYLETVFQIALPYTQKLSTQQHEKHLNIFITSLKRIARERKAVLL